MAVTAPEYYERSPDGAQWPGTLKGLLAALEDTVMTSLQVAGDFTLLAVREGHAVPFRTYRNGVYS